MTVHVAHAIEDKPDWGLHGYMGRDSTADSGLLDDHCLHTKLPLKTSTVLRPCHHDSLELQNFAKAPNIGFQANNQ